MLANALLWAWVLRKCRESFFSYRLKVDVTLCSVILHATMARNDVNSVWFLSSNKSNLSLSKSVNAGYISRTTTALSNYRHDRWMTAVTSTTCRAKRLGISKKRRRALKPPQAASTNPSSSPHPSTPAPRPPKSSPPAPQRNQHRRQRRFSATPRLEPLHPRAHQRP